LAVVAAPACATKKFVRTEVGKVDSKVDTLTGSLEQTQERTSRNEDRIGSVEGKAETAGRSAQEARAAADAAAASAGQVGTRVDQVATDAAANFAATNAALADGRKLLYEVTINEAQGKFKFGQTALPDEAKARLDQVVDQLKGESKNVFIEIEGHTDNAGDAVTNQRLGLQRAEATKRYLYEELQVPLHKMNVISYGEEKPVAPNRNRDGRAQNRRVVVKVLS
jgi:outer membrane protein OmpA-like peptidoglycan-associated protein